MFKQLVSVLVFSLFFIKSFAGHEGNGTGPVQGMLQRTLVKVNDVLKLEKNRTELSLLAYSLEESSVSKERWKEIFNKLFEITTMILANEERYLSYDFSSEEAFDAENEKTWMVHLNSQIVVRPRVYPMLFGERVNPKQIYVDLIHELLHFQMNREEQIHSIQSSLTKALADKMDLDRIFADFKLGALTKIFRSERPEHKQNFRCGLEIISVASDLKVTAKFISNPPAKRARNCDLVGELIELHWYSDLVWYSKNEESSLQIYDLDTNQIRLNYKGEDIFFQAFDIEKGRKVTREW